MLCQVTLPLLLKPASLSRSISLSQWHFSAQAGAGCLHGARLGTAGSERGPCPHPGHVENQRGTRATPRACTQGRSGLCTQPVMVGAAWHLKRGRSCSSRNVMRGAAPLKAEPPGTQGGRPPPSHCHAPQELPASALRQPEAIWKARGDNPRNKSGVRHRKQQSYTTSKIRVMRESQTRSTARVLLQ